jgi:hypothetical protein
LLLLLPEDSITAALVERKLGWSRRTFISAEKMGRLSLFKHLARALSARPRSRESKKEEG